MVEAARGYGEPSGRGGQWRGGTGNTAQASTNILGPRGSFERFWA